MSRGASDFEGAEGEPETLGLRNNFVLSGDSVNSDYKVGVLNISDPPGSFSCIAVCLCDNKVLVAVPEGAWARLKRDRALPQSALKKAVRVEVQPCSPGDRATPAGPASLPIWLGLLSPPLEEAVDYAEDVEPAEVDFPARDDGTQLLPLATALVAVSRDHFAFMTAESEVPKPTSGVLEGRMDKMEESINQLIALVSDLRKPAPAAPAAPPGLPQPQKAAAPDQRARQALAAGVDPAALGELRGMLGLPEPPVSRRPLEPKGAVNVESSEDEAEEADLAEGGSAGVLGKAVVSLTKIVKDIHKEKKKSKDRGLESILDQAEGSGSHRDAGGASRSKAAALRSLQQLLVSDPALIYQAIEKNLQADWELSGSTPGMNVSQISVRGWIEHRSRIQNYPSSVRPAWILGGVWDCLRNGRAEEARARAALGVAMLDQQSCDRGAWLLAAEASLEAPPPYSSFNSHTAPEASELQHSRLLDPRWVELFLAKLKDLADYQEKRSKLITKQKSPEQPGPKADPKPKEKGGGKGKSKAKKENPEEKTGQGAAEA